MSMTMFRNAKVVTAVFVAAFVAALACPVRAGGEQEKLLCGFEKEYIQKMGHVEKDGKIVTARRGRPVPLSEQASQGKWSYFSKHTDRYNFLRRDNKTTFYIRWRSGRVFRTLGWFQKVMPQDWSGYPLLRLDYRTDGPAVRLRMEVEDMFLSFPVAQSFRVPGNKWVTLEVDLEKAVKERRLDLKRMALPGLDDGRGLSSRLIVKKGSPWSKP